MASWDTIDMNFGNDETSNFGPRQESGSALYQVDTVVTISPRGEVEQNPSVVATACEDYTAVGVENQVSLFNDAWTTFLITLTLDSEIDALAFSSDCLFLMIGERNGTLHFLDVTSQRVFFSESLGPTTTQTGKPFFADITFSPVEEDVCDLYVLTTSSKLFTFEGFLTTRLHQALKDQNLLTAKKIQDSIKKRVLDDGHNIEHARTMTIPHTDTGRCVITGGNGDSVLTIWKKEDGGIKEYYDICAKFYPGVIKCQFSNDGDYVFTLDEEHHLSIWDLNFGDQIKKWVDVEYQDFMLLENGKKCESIADLEIIGLTIPIDGHCFLEVRGVAQFEVLYSLKLAEDTFLTHGPPYQANVFVIEGVKEENETLVSTLRIRAISEAEPEMRLYRLLHKEKFSEAESFAKLFRLDVELVQKVKASHMLNKLSPWKIGELGDEEVTNMIAELREGLDMIRNESFITEQCISAALPTFQETMGLLLYAESRLNKSSCPDSERDVLMSKITKTINRLQTFGIAYEEDYQYSAQRWDNFKNGNLLYEILNLIGKNRLTPAFIIWERNQEDFEEQLNVDLIEDILYSIYEGTKVCEIQPWLEQYFIPFVIKVCPEGLPKVASWIEERTRKMEWQEKDCWPQNALSFAKVLQNVCNGLRLECSVELFNQVSQSNIEELLSLQNLIQQLTNIWELQTVYHCKLSLADYLKETTDSVVFRMLDQVRVSQKLPTAIEKLVEPYMKQHQLSRDKLLLEYIINMLERSQSDGSNMCSVWEERVIAVIDCLHSVDHQCMAIIQVMTKAYIPWSKMVEDLVNKGLAMKHSKASSIREHYHLVKLKKMLSRYDLKNYSVSEGADNERLLYYILKQDIPTAVEDALEVVEAFDNVNEEMLYMFRIRFLVKYNRLKECYELIRSLSTNLALKCGIKLVLNTVRLLADPIDFAPEETKKIKIIQTTASVAICGILEPIFEQGDPWYDEIMGYRADLEHIRALQVEYGEFLSVEEYRFEKKREELLSAHVKSFFSKSSQQEKTRPWDEDRKTGAVKGKSYSTIYRLADLLKISRDRLRGRLAVQAAKAGDVQVAVNICKELQEQVMSERTANTLYEVAYMLHGVLPDENCKSPLENLPIVIHELAMKAVAFCSPGLLPDCLELCKCTSLTARVSKCTESGDYGSTVKEKKESLDGFSIDPYKEWSFSKIYKEEGLVMDSSIAVPIISQYSTVCLPQIGVNNYPYVQHRLGGTSRLVLDDKEKQENQEESAREEPTSQSILEQTESVAMDCIQYLRENSQESLALKMAIDFTHVLQQHLVIQNMGYPNNKATTDVIECEQKKLSGIIQTSMTMIRNFSMAMLLKLFSGRYVDELLALNGLLGMSKKEVHGVFKKMQHSTGLNYKRLIDVANIGIEYSLLTRDRQGLPRLYSMLKDATWGHRLAKVNVAFREAFQGPTEDKWKIIQQFVEKDTSISIIREYCRDYELGEEKAFFEYLQYLLVASPSSGEEKSSSHTNQGWENKALQVIECLPDFDAVGTKLTELLNKVDPYDYEKLTFILKVLMVKCPSAVVDKWHQLLLFLKFYKRMAPPSEYELSYGTDTDDEQLIYGTRYLSPLSKERLPFHPLVSGNPWKIVSPELYLSTKNDWLLLSKKLKLPEDQIYLITVRNVISRHVEDLKLSQNFAAQQEKSKCNWKIEDVDVKFYEEIHDLVMKVQNVELAVACINWIIKELPMGAEKVYALKACVALAESWSRTCPPDSPEKSKAMAAYKKFFSSYKRLSTEQILYRHNMGMTEFLQLAVSPAKLIFQLYEHPSIAEREQNPFGNYPDIHKITNEIASINMVDIAKIRMALVEKWLPNASGQTQDDADVTLTFNFQLTGGGDVEEEGVEQFVDDNLKRVIYISKYLLPDCSLKPLMTIGFSNENQTEVTNLGKLRVLYCALALADTKLVALMAGVSESELPVMMKNLRYIFELEELHIPHTLQSFDECNKEGLVRAIWKTRSRERKALLLMCHLCLDYGIHDVKLWNGIVKQMLTLGMTNALKRVIPNLPVADIGLHFSCLPRAWNSIITAPFTSAVSPLSDEQKAKCISSLSLLRKCPVLHELDLNKISQLYMNVGLVPCAMYCQLLSAKTTTGQQSIEDFIENENVTELLDQIALLEKKGLQSAIVEQLTQSVFSHLQEREEYTSLHDSSHFMPYLNYLISKDDIDNLLVMTITLNRLDEADRLIILFNNYHGLNTHEPARNQLKEYLKEKGMFNTLQDKFPDEEPLFEDSD